jgi:hypothetical protein
MMPARRLFTFQSRSNRRDWRAIVIRKKSSCIFFRRRKSLAAAADSQ